MNDKPVCEQVNLGEFRVVLAVEPLALTDKKNGMGKSEPADQLLLLLFFFLISPLKRCQDTIQLGQSKMRTKMTESCTRRFLPQIAKYSHGKKGIKRRQPANPANDSCRICKYFLTLSMELEIASILIVGFVGSR